MDAFVEKTPGRLHLKNRFILPIKSKSLGNTRKHYKNGSDPTVVSLLSS